MIVAGPVLKEKVTRFYEIPIGDVVKLRCPVGGTPKPKLTWFKGDTLIVFNDRIKQSKYSLTINSSKKEDSDNYTCLAINEFGNLKVIFSLKIVDPLPQDEPLSPFVFLKNKSNNTHDLGE